MNRGEIRYADLGEGFGRRPVLICTATEIITVLTSVTCAPITTRLYEIPTRVPLGRTEGLSKPSEAVCDSLMSIPKGQIDPTPTGHLSPARFGELDRAIARSLDIQRRNLLPG